MDPLINTTRDQMQKAFDVLKQDFSTVRTGKANPASIENIVIKAYGGTTPLKVLELATIHIQDAQTLIVTPYDQSVIGEIQKGITDASIGVSAVVDKNIIRISMPPLTEERRKDFVKLVNQKAENGRVMIRQIRHESMEDIKKKAGSNSVSEDEIERLEKEIQKLTDDYIEKVDALRQEKEEELMKI